MLLTSSVVSSISSAGRSPHRRPATETGPPLPKGGPFSFYIKHRQKTFFQYYVKERSLSKTPNQKPMVIRSNSPRTVTPHVRLQKRIPLKMKKSGTCATRHLLSEEGMHEAAATQHIRKVLTEINQKVDGEQAFFLLADFFGKHPVETLRPRTVKELALVLSRGKAAVEKTMWLLELLEISLSTHGKAEALCDKLKQVGFDQDEKGLRRARNLHLIIKRWEMSLLNEKRSHGIAA